MSIDQHVSVSIRVNSAGIALEGFGTIGIVSYKALWPERKRTYRRLADAIADGFPSDSPEALAIAAILAQSPHPTQVAVLRGTRAPTQRYQLEVAAVRNGFPYQIKVQGEGVTATTVEYESDADATNDEIVNGLLAALNAVVGKNFTATTSGDPGDLVLLVTADAPGEWFALEVVDTSALSIAQTHADPGLADDLHEINLADPDWYYFYTTFNSSAVVLAAAAWAEATPFKFYLGETSDSDVENLAAGAGDVADQHNELGRRRSILTYRRQPYEMFGAGLAGRLAPLPVGSWTAAYKTIANSTPDAFTATQITNLDAKRVTYYKREAGRAIAWEGKVGNLDYGFMDVTVSLDFVLDLIQKRVFGLKVARNKVAYTDEDIAMAESTVEGAIDIAKSDKHKIVARGTPGDPNDPVPTVKFPRVREIDPSAREVRELPDGAVSFRLQGAVHKTLVDLTVSH